TAEQDRRVRPLVFREDSLNRLMEVLYLLLQQASFGFQPLALLFELVANGFFIRQDVDQAIGRSVVMRGSRHSSPLEHIQRGALVGYGRTWLNAKSRGHSSSVQRASCGMFSCFQ